MRVLAVDLGSVRTGLAVSDELGILASPLPPLRRTESIRKDARAIAETAERLKAQKIVVGLPVGLDGTEGPAATMAREMAERISRYTRIPVVLHDERWTTVEAAERLREAGLDSRRARQIVDSQAAAVLLESYLETARQMGMEDTSAP
ncbi:MAG: putative pre-16S rRNA nuclease [Armatimonadota bacterium]|nr:MAG: putative pre-16S rRNA nuclease [Armatimonadota bacterium]